MVVMISGASISDGERSSSVDWLGDWLGEREAKAEASEASAEERVASKAGGREASEEVEASAVAGDLERMRLAAASLSLSAPQRITKTVVSMASGVAARSLRVARVLAEDIEEERGEEARSE